MIVFNVFINYFLNFTKYKLVYIHAQNIKTIMDIDIYLNLFLLAHILYNFNLYNFIFRILF